MSLVWVAHRLRQDDPLVRAQPQDLGQCGTVKAAANHGRQPFGSAEQIDILSDEAGVGGHEQVAVGRAAAGLGQIGNVDQVQGCDMRLNF